jgi:hypothetical protein
VARIFSESVGVPHLLKRDFTSKKREHIMKKLQKHLIPVAALVGLATVTMMMYPHSTSAASSSAVQVVPNNPFAKTGSNGSGLPATISVPASHHLAIETLSLQTDVTPSGSKLEAIVSYTSGGNSASVFVPLTFAYTTPSNGFDTYVATQEVRLYADPGTTINFTTFTPIGSIGTSFLTASGYLF